MCQPLGSDSQSCLLMRIILEILKNSNARRPDPGPVSSKSGVCDGHQYFKRFQCKAKIEDHGTSLPLWLPKAGQSLGSLVTASQPGLSSEMGTEKFGKQLSC